MLEKELHEKIVRVTLDVSDRFPDSTIEELVHDTIASLGEIPLMKIPEIDALIRKTIDEDVVSSVDGYGKIIS
jgi:hypothetical protein